MAACRADIGGDGYQKGGAELGWHPTHSSAETLAALVKAV